MHGKGEDFSKENAEVPNGKNRAYIEVETETVGDGGVRGDSIHLQD